MNVAQNIKTNLIGKTFSVNGKPHKITVLVDWLPADRSVGILNSSAIVEIMDLDNVPNTQQVLIDDMGGVWDENDNKIADSGIENFGIEIPDTEPEDELPEGVEAVCENCGKPCDYDSEMCLCPTCWRTSQG